MGYLVIVHSTHHQQGVVPAYLVIRLKGSVTMVTVGYMVRLVLQLMVGGASGATGGAVQAVVGMEFNQELDTAISHCKHNDNYNNDNNNL